MPRDPVPEPPSRRPGKSLKFRLLSAGFGAAERVLPRGVPALDAARIAAAADGAMPDFAREGLERLTASLAAESRLSLFGRVSVRYDLIRLARNAEAIRRMHAASPAIGREAVRAPVFIMGLPRSGTTFLHTLFGQDPEVLVPRVWQTLYPAARPVGFDARRSAAVRRTDRQLDMFAGMAPEFPAIHPIEGDSPQECSEITAHVFHSLRFDTTFRVPSYTAWLDAEDDGPAFAFHKQWLQAMQHGTGGRFWALKCPEHTFSVKAILETYPDARFVVVHRDPVHVFASVAHMTEVLRRPFLRDIDPVEIGRQVTERWIDGARRLVAFDQSGAVPAERLVNIQYDRLTADPIGVVAGIYARFGETFTPAAETAMRQHLDAAPRGGYGRNRYRLADFGINAERLRPRFTGYVEYFGVQARKPGGPQPA